MDNCVLSRFEMIWRVKSEIPIMYGLNFGRFLKQGLSSNSVYKGLMDNCVLSLFEMIRCVKSEIPIMYALIIGRFFKQSFSSNNVHKGLMDNCVKRFWSFKLPGGQYFSDF